MSLLTLQTIARDSISYPIDSLKNNRPLIQSIQTALHRMGFSIGEATGTWNWNTELPSALLSKSWPSRALFGFRSRSERKFGLSGTLACGIPQLRWAAIRALPVNPAKLQRLVTAAPLHWVRVSAPKALELRNGAVVREARRLGLAAPVNERLLAALG